MRAAIISRLCFPSKLHEESGHRLGAPDGLGEID